MEAIAVRSYAGSRGEEEPRAVLQDGVWVDVTDVTRAWREPSGRFFAVTLASGAKLLLHCSEPDMQWSRAGDDRRA